jgi:hypothetical protein
MRVLHNNEIKQYLDYTELFNFYLIFGLLTLTVLSLIYFNKKNNDIVESDLESTIVHTNSYNNNSLVHKRSWSQNKIYRYEI